MQCTVEQCAIYSSGCTCGTCKPGHSGATCAAVRLPEHWPVALCAIDNSRMLWLSILPDAVHCRALHWVLGGVQLQCMRGAIQTQWGHLHHGELAAHEGGEPAFQENPTSFGSPGLQCPVISRCTAYQSDCTCRICEAGLSPAADGATCVQVSIEAVMSGSSSSRAVAWHQHVPAACCVQCTTPNCKTYSSEGSTCVCTGCEAGYSLSNGACSVVRREGCDVHACSELNGDLSHTHHTPTHPAVHC